MADDVSELVKQTARQLLRHLRTHPEGASKDELVDASRVSRPSVQRALTWLRDSCDSPVEFDRAQGRWILRDPHFSLSLSDPQAEDLAAVLFAEALLAPMADEEITGRVRRLAEQMDAEIRERTAAAPDAPGARPGTLVASMTTGASSDPTVLATLLKAAGRGVVEIHYASPWSQPPQTRVYTLEPWQLRMHDGTLYLRAFTRER